MFLSLQPGRGLNWLVRKAEFPSVGPAWEGSGKHLGIHKAEEPAPSRLGV